MSEPRQDAEPLPIEFRQTLAELEMLSHGRTQSYAAATAPGESEGYGRPPGSEFPPHIVWRSEWMKAKDDHRRYEVMRLATEELASYRRSSRTVTVVEETEEELEERVVKTGKGWTVEETARHCRCTPTFVRRARLKAGVNAVTGAQPKDKPQTDDPRERARQLAGEGYTERQIVMLTGLAKTTIRRLLGRAA
jgi:hypothetical protein